LAEAESLLAELIAISPTPRGTNYRLCQAAAAEVALACRETSSALAIIDALIDGETAPRIGLLRGKALAALGRRESADETLRAALQAAEQAGLAALSWRIGAALARVLRTTRRAPEADAVTEGARTTIAKLAATLPAQQASAFRREAERLLPAPLIPTTLRAAKQAAGGLTAREREIAAAIAAGLTNRQIADALVISDRTVEYHVGNILGKLGFATRSQVAAWAVERHLR
jgi:DNA-binding NarL/FixJ family response regulator